MVLLLRVDIAIEVVGGFVGAAIGVDAVVAARLSRWWEKVGVGG